MCLLLYMCVGGVQNMCIYMCNVHPHVYILIYMYIPVFSVSIQSTILYPLL